MRLIVSRNPARSGLTSGNRAQLGALALLVINDLLRVVEAAAALRLAVVGSVGSFGRARPFARSGANLFLSDGVADTDDHAGNIALLRRVRNYLSWNRRTKAG